MVHNEHLTPITDALLGQGDSFAVTIPRTEGGFNAYAFEITRTAKINKEITEMQDIAAGGTVTPDLLREDGHDDQQAGLSGDNVYRLNKETEPNRIYHFGQLWQPEDLQIYWENPNGELPQGFTRSTEVAVDDDEGWTVWSDDTVYTDKIPSTALETIILPGVTPFIGFENAGETVVRPTAKFHGLAYEVEPLNAFDLDLAVRVTTGLNEGPRAPLAHLGGISEFSISTPEEWGDGVSLTGQELAALAGVRLGARNEGQALDRIKRLNGGS